jgi:3-oxoacyl-[acyl-carrier protein] reductase
MPHGARSTGTEIAMTSSLANKTALVTGASRGMGRATALALAEAGARVIVHYGRNADEAKAVVDQIRAAGGRAEAVAADLAAPNGPHALAAEVRNLTGNRLDILVSNAGISKAASIENITIKDFDELFAVNVRAPYFLLQQLLPILSDSGSVVFVSSLGARAAVGTLSAYAATKGAINTLVKYFAAALGPRGIRVNAVAPGVIDTDMSNFTKTEDGRKTVMAMQTLKRIGQPDDVASVVAFLASDEARWITGDTIAVDGGSKL